MRWKTGEGGGGERGGCVGKPAEGRQAEDVMTEQKGKKRQFSGLGRGWGPGEGSCGI